MAMEDIVPSIVLIGIVYFIFRWFNKPSTGAQSATPTGIRGVTRSMVETVQSAFPDIPAPNIVYSLSRTRSAQATSEEILERGYLPAPPASFNIPTLLLPEQAPTQAPVTPVKAASVSRQTLIERYNLNERLPSVKGKERELPVGEPAEERAKDVKGEWADTKDKRERELRERKERMILEARRRLLEKQSKETPA